MYSSCFDYCSPKPLEKPITEELQKESQPTTHHYDDLPCDGDIDTQPAPSPRYLPDDIFAIQNTLRHFVPVEIADIILDYAEFWPWLSVSRNAYPTALTALEAPDSDAQWCYLVSPPVPALVRNGTPMPTRVNMVKFQLKAYPTVWGNQMIREDLDTWFEASILKADSGVVYDTSVPDPHQWYTDLAQQPKLLNSFSPDPLSSTSQSAINNPLDEQRRWYVTANTTLSKECWKEVAWRRMDSGATSEFVDALSVGDRVVLMVRAPNPGWLSTIFNAKIEFYYSLMSSPDAALS
ncbi:hypothetical protein CVT24_011273 [Panaeolus cyanescens]|uniref:Uncharacterized protein n=1 Tax=Panaeolus cyanescens TaxID=181874 RepID=A0A409VLR1_9AGAR|nr:hypothetical protein CVT24_011273 [Panaeolus cyanescens]